jgi:hypothetical protein
MTAGMRRPQHHCSVRANALGLSVAPVMESVSAPTSCRATADDRGNSEQFPETLTDRSAQIDMENLNRHGR